MRRPDLTDEGKYDGWQVLDPTPQELSDGTDFTVFFLLLIVHAKGFIANVTQK